MNLFKNYFIIFIFFPIFIFDIFLFKFFKKKNSELSYQYLIKLYCLFGNTILDFISFILCYRKKVNYCQSHNKLEINKDYFNKIIDISEAVNLLNFQGYYHSNNFINHDCIKNISSFLEQKKGFYYSDALESDKLFNLDVKNPKGTKFAYRSDDLIQSHEIQHLLISPNILSIAQEYLGCLPQIDIITAWWNFASQEPDNKAAQFWHFDLDRPKWVKIFIFLTDCEEKNGPHKFISGSHLNIPYLIRTKGYTRLQDKEVSLFYKNERIKTFKSKKGSILFEDTKGLHKGQKVDEGSRLILQFQYSSSLFGAKNEKIMFPNNCSEKFFEFKSKYEKMFNNFY